MLPMLDGNSRDVTVHAELTEGTKCEFSFSKLYIYIFLMVLGFFSTCPTRHREFSDTIVQVVTVGVVGGSDLSKISEQLGKTGIL